MPSAAFPRKSKALYSISDIKSHTAVPNPIPHLDIPGKVSKQTWTDDTVEAEHQMNYKG